MKDDRSQFGELSPANRGGGDRDPARAFQLLGLKPDAWQAEVVRSGAGQILLNCSRQAGKSTVAAALALYEALFVPGSTVLIVSRSERQSTEVMRVITQGLLRVDTVRLKTHSSTEVEVERGGRVVSLPCREDTVRGFSGATLLIIDEAARVPDEVMRALRPSLAVRNGRLICLSTPFGRRGFFHDAWSSPDSAWLRVRVPVNLVPRISKEFLKKEERALGADAYAQEYLCEFRAYQGAVYPTFETCLVDQAPPSVGPRWGGIDFGFRNPTAAVEGFWETPTRFVVDLEIYRAGLSPAELAAHLGKGVFYFADPSNTGAIRDLRRLDIKAARANNAFMAGVGTLTRLINTGTLVVVRSRCPNLVEEAQALAYASPSNGQSSESLTEGTDHALDALRYLAMGIMTRRRPTDWRDPRNHAPSDRDPNNPNVG